jgi:hypothetical protein
LTVDPYRALVEDRTLWDMPTIAGELGVQYQTVKTWRKDTGWPRPKLPEERAAPQNKPRNGVHPNLLPAPDMTLSGKPVWFAGTIRFWAMQTGRMSPEGVARKRKPPGRPKATAAAAAAESALRRKTAAAKTQAA